MDRQRYNDNGQWNGMWNVMEEGGVGVGYKGFAICNICQAKVSRGGFWDNSSMKAYLRLKN